MCRLNIYLVIKASVCVPPLSLSIGVGEFTFYLPLRTVIAQFPVASPVFNMQGVSMPSSSSGNLPVNNSHPNLPGLPGRVP